ncbi:MbnP family copper-binding protein [Rheinheimera maricola]|uniref:Metallo-mystery pair system four-Cys motif protein n=1 Tax=Rheinheimera maricola TaxID=2793282 RepID=A0ABS7X5H8_9GAMM|nr:MbnP family copper-binding protein [Rheinheimera maricola]MBZ9609988.1 metallo-mystery pair system four-Cys motif protein [Rheinheimera maricola]
MLRRSLIVLSALLSGCSPSAPDSNASSLAVQLWFNGAPLRCSDTITLAQQPWQLAQFQLYLSDISLNNKPLLLDPTPLHQQPQLALLGTVCGESANDNWQLKFTRPLSAGVLAFTVGVPASRNHQDPLRAASPLNQSDMFWSWQQGYKYLRLELAGAAQQWALHLGATGCQSASPMRPPTTSCQQPNLARISVNYQRGQILTLDLAPILAEFTPATDNHCMSDPNRLSCQTLLPRLGINGTPLGWSMQ